MRTFTIIVFVTILVILLSSSIEAKKKDKSSKSSSDSIIDEDDTKSFENSDKMKNYIKNLSKKNAVREEESLNPEELKQLEEEERKLKIGAALAVDEHDDMSREHANALHRLGKTLHKQKKFDELVNVAKKIVQIHETLDGPEHFNTAQALGNLGASAFHLRDWKTVEHAMKRALYIFIQQFGESSKEVLFHRGRMLTYGVKDGDKSTGLSYDAYLEEL